MCCWMPFLLAQQVLLWQEMDAAAEESGAVPAPNNSAYGISLASLGRERVTAGGMGFATRVLRLRLVQRAA